MPLLADYAVTPDVFDVDSYSNEDACRQSLELIRETLLTEGLVRNLRKDEWRNLLLNDNSRSWYRRSKEIIRKLFDQQRLIEVDPALPNQPADDQGWCAEALGTCQAFPFSGGVIVTESVKKAYPQNLVARIDRLGSAEWWASRSPSVTLDRSIRDYKKHLDLILRYSNSLMFTDPYLDPVKEFVDLLIHAGNRTPPPSIELHRVCYEGSGPNREILNVEDIEKNFRDRLESHLRSAGLKVTVFVWDDFHDRYLISNLIGLSLPYGFGTGTYPRLTRWTRLGRCDRDSVQREFDKASKQHKLHKQFPIP